MKNLCFLDIQEIDNQACMYIFKNTWLLLERPRDVIDTWENAYKWCQARGGDLFSKTVSIVIAHNFELINQRLEVAGYPRLEKKWHWCRAQPNFLDTAPVVNLLVTNGNGFGVYNKTEQSYYRCIITKE